MEDRGIVFFSKDDLAFHWALKEIHNYFQDKKHLKQDYSFNEILELHHICEYIDNGFVYNEWNTEKLNEIKNEIKDFKRKQNVYFKQITAEFIIDKFDEISYDYLKTFWLLINKFNVYKIISIDDLKILFKKERFDLKHILYCSKIVNFYEQEIRKYIISKEINAEILLDYFEKQHDRKQQEKFFPKSLSTRDCEDLISKYIDYEDANLNYLRLIVKSKDSDFLRLSDKVKLKAKKLADKINDEILNSENATTIHSSVCLSDDQDEIKKIINNSGEPFVSYSKKRLLEKLDNLTLFENFRKVFEFLNFQGCINSIPSSSEIDGFEMSFVRSKNEYLVSFSFQSKSIESRMNFEIYSYFLDSISVKLEDILEDFVNNHLNNKFSINRFKLFLPSPESNILEKIRLIVPEFESLIEQYKLYVEDDFVDFELLQVSTKTSGFEKIPSLLERKYVYPKGDEYQKIRYNFFEHSYLFDYEKFGKKYSCFYHTLLYEKVNVDDYKDHKREYLQHFIDIGYLKVEQDGSISFTNKNLMIIIGYLRNFDVMSYWHFPKYIRDEIDKMQEKKLVEFSDKLFTKAEQDYFNFYLNNKFSNGLWLRNKYVHATNSHEKEEQETDYKILLKLLILLVLKIENDLNIAKSIITSYQNTNKR